MTREAAIKIIKECKEKGFKHTFYTVNEYYAALDMAINALGASIMTAKEERCSACVCNPFDCGTLPCEVEDDREEFA